MNKNIRPMGYSRRPACMVGCQRPPMAGDLARRQVREEGCCESVPAMVFPTAQEYCDLYQPDAALCRGTLFKALDKPFCY